MKNISILSFIICSLFCLTLPLYGQSFRFALITDLHITKDSILVYEQKTGNSFINTVVPHDSKECLFTSSKGIAGVISDVSVKSSD